MKQLTHRGARWFGLCPRRHLALLCALGVIVLCRLCCKSRAAANFVVRRVTGPLEAFLARLCSAVPFSVAELCWAGVVLTLLLLVGRGVVCLARGGGVAVYRTLLSLLVLGAALYGGFCLLWGIQYYADSFSDQSGLAAEPVTAAQLQQATRIFADGVNRTANTVPRNEANLVVLDTQTLLDESLTIYDALCLDYPFLQAEPLRPKALTFSRLLSRMDFTGFYFPFTGEANINTDFPDAMRPFTIAHELAHQRTVASEQEANFVGIRACLSCGLADYEYAGWLSGYIYLANALYQADYDAWVTVSASLCDEARADLAENNRYWAQFQQSATAKASGSVYDKFLKSYDQKLGRHSYGACVDLLCAYWVPAAADETT